MNERAIFDAAIQIQDLEQRRLYLEQACGKDPILRARIEALLASHEQAGSFLNIPAVEPFHGSKERDDERAQQTLELDLSFLSRSSRTDSLGRLGHYEILEVLGQGAFGIVFKAFDDHLHRLVAIKVLSPQLAATSPPRKRFLREARSAAAIRHENIVQVHSVEEQPLPYLVMEYIEGSTLQQRLDGTGPLEVAEILQIGRQLAAGLAAAHAKGLIHRDIKPGNVLLEKDATGHRVKLTDFGLARAADDASLTRTGLISGTPLYMAPEQAEGAPLDHRTDLFSLGSVLYVMASGRPPFRADNPIAVLKRVTQETPRPIQEIIPEVPNWLCAIIGRLHAKQRAARFQSAQEVADLLARCQLEIQTYGRVRSRLQESDSGPTLPPVLSPPETPPTVQAGHKPQQDHTSIRPVWVAVALLLLLGGFLLALMTGIYYWRFQIDPVWTPPVDGSAVKVPNGASDSMKTEGQPSFQQPPAPQAQEAPITVVDPDRKAAEYVLSIGGSVSIHGMDDEVTTVAGLPQETFELSTISLRENEKVTDSGLAACYGCKNLSNLDLVRTSVTDAGLKYFAASKRLSILDLVSAPIGDDGLAVFKGISTLSSLWLSHTKVTDAGLANFFNCKGLRYLDLVNTNISDTGLAHFAGLKTLDGLYLAQTPITDRGLAHFQDNLQLTELWLGETEFTDEGMACFRNCKNLTKLWLGGTNLTDAGLVHFQGCKQLVDLSVMNTWVTDQGLAAFQDCSELKIAWLGHLDLTDAALTHFKNWPKLSEVYLDRTKITDAGMVQFRDLQQLTLLSLTHTEVSDQGLAELHGCKQLACLYLRNTKITPDGIRQLRQALPACAIEWDGSATEAASPPAPSGYVSLFNGQDLTGLEVLGNANAVWKVQDGVLTGNWRNRDDVSGGSILYTPRNDYQNFRFRMQCTLSENWSTSMRFLWPDVTKRGGFLRAMIGATSGPEEGDTGKLRLSLKTPSLAVPAVPLKLRKDQWFTQEVVVQGRRIQVYVNDILCTEHELPTTPPPGHLGVELSGNASIRIRKLEVQELPPVAVR